MRKVLYCKMIVTKPAYDWQSPSITYSGMDNKGYFHRFAESENDTYAIIEEEDGNVIFCNITKFKFVDSPKEIE